MIIGITGKKFSGKSTAAQMLADFLGDTKIVSFADVLKEKMIKEGLCTYEEAYVSKPPEFRKQAQEMGDHLRACFGEDIFIIELAKKVHNLQKQVPGITVIIDDVRLVNEAHWIAMNDGVIIKMRRAALEDGDKHRTETEVERIKHDLLISNNKGPDELRKKIEEIIEDDEIRPIASLRYKEDFLCGLR